VRNKISNVLEILFSYIQHENAKACYSENKKVHCAHTTASTKHKLEERTVQPYFLDQVMWVPCDGNFGV